MGPKRKTKISKENIYEEQRQEKSVVLAREQQRRRRARLILGETEKKERAESASESPHGTFQGIPEEVSVEMDIKEECCSEEEGEKIQEEGPESEPLPGPKGQLLYYDGGGYYYTQLYEDVTYRWLQCSHGECKVMAKMRRQEKASIHLVDQSCQHDHPANPARRDRILFLHTIKTRHAKESTPFSVIFQQEAYKNPVGASFFSFDKIQAHLQKKISLGGSDNLSQESVLSAASKLSMPLTAIDKPSTEMEPVVKKMRIDKDTPKLGNLSKKLQLLKSLKDVSFTECETSEPTVPPPSKPSERIPGLYPHSYLYHDGFGNFYKPLAISGNTRYLICNTVGCHAKAVMALEENAPISLATDSPAHNHTLPEKEVLNSPAIRPINIISIEGQEKENRKVVEEAENRDANRTPMVVLNKFTVAPKKKRFERLEGPEYYYDFKGHYYFTTRVDRTKRFLRCLYPTCLAQAIMPLDDDAAEIQPISGSRPHNHKPDYTTKFHSKIKQWEEQWSECLPSERLPSLRVQYCCYHDGRGYYYHQTSQSDNIRYLACAEPQCPVKAYMSPQKDAPITISGLRMGHSHGPDHTLRDALLFIDAVRVRTRSDVAPASAIALEAARNSVGAGRVDLQTLRLCLEQAAKLASNKYKDGIVEDEVDFVLCVKPKKSVTMKPSTESQVPVPNHFTSPVPILDDYWNKNEDKKYTKAELIPALLSDSWMYHDGCGYYYNTRSIKNGFRYLQCVLPKCGVRALVAQAGGPVNLQKPHSHGPQPPQHRFELWFFHRIKIRAQKNPDMQIGLIYQEVANKDPEGAALVSQAEVIELVQKYLTSVVRGNVGDNASRHRCLVHIPLKAEILPSTVSRCQYHDGQGYYYYTVDNAGKKTCTTYLKCSYRAACPARAFLVDGKINMNGNTRHNHNPDLIHRDICLFSQALKKRARDEYTPVSVIYEEEAKKYPKAAAVLREDILIGKLTSIRRYVRREMSIQTQEEESEDSLNCNNQSRSYVASEVFPGRTRDVYHDGGGYFYHETFTTNQMRYLICCEPHCLAQAKMGLMAGSPVLGQAGSPCHCHAPDPLRRNFLMLVSNVRRRAAQHNLKPDTLYQQESAKEPVVAAQIPKIYLYTVIKNVRLRNKMGMDQPVMAQDIKEDDELWTFSDAGERLPSEHGWLYHNGKGYFYYSHDTDKSQTRRILRCCEEGCDSTAQLEDDLRVVRAPGSLLHNHTPEPRCRAMLLLLHRVATRAQLENTSVADIYEEEAKRDPDGAALVPKNKLNETLQSLTVRRYFKELEEDELCAKEDFSEEVLRDDEVSVEPCEVLPSASSEDPVYHDSEGHYYTGLRKTYDRQYVKCLMPLCNARGYIDSSEPWKLHVPKRWEEHNHKSDPHYRDKLLFVNNVRRRSLNEDTPVDVIYREEREKDPFGSDQVNEASIKNLMYKLRKSKNVGDNIETFPFEDFTGHTAEGIANKASEPPAETQNNIEDVGRHEIQSDKSVMIQVKVERMEAEEEGENEYTVEEFLEEEGLGEKQIVENSSTKNTNETSMETDKVHLPTEKLPSRTNSNIYHNGKGYYFQANTVKDNILYVRCVEPRCKMRGMKLADREDAPIIHTKKNVIHNHRPDFTRRKHMLFVQGCKERAAAETNLTINEIWESEVARDPETASQFAQKNIKSQMIRYRALHAANSDTLSTGPRDTQEQSLEDGITFHDASITDPITEKPHVDIHGETVPEKIPSLVGDTLWYAAGYFYSTYNTSGSIEKVKCVEKDCVARAQVTLGDKGQPLSIRLTKTTAHGHPADLQRRDQMLFIERCKRRARTTLQSVEEIYYDEAAKAPEVAAQLSAVRVKRAMGFAKKERMKKGIRLVSKEWDDSAASGDYGMAELGEMAKIQASTPAVVNTEEAGASDSGAQEDSDYYYAEETIDDTDDLWTVDPKALSPEEKTTRRKALARERQRRRRTRMVEDPEKWEQLEKEKEKTRQRALVWQRQKKAKLKGEKTEDDIDSGSKTTPMLVPKFLKELVNTTNEEEFQEEEELIDQTYSDYVTLEEELDSCETGLQNEEEEEVKSSVQNAGQDEGAYELEKKMPKNTKPSHLVHGRRVNSYCYHDGSGFYYDTLKISDNYRYLKCVVVGCQAQGFMPLGQDGAPIILTRESPAHFHPPDPRHKGLVRFVNQCESRALKEDIPLQNIYDEEAEADPVSASKLVMENLLQRMTKIRKESLESRIQSMELSATEGPVDIKENVLENDEESGHLSAEENETERSEVLPGYRPNSAIFHDMKGYYFIFNALKENKRYLRCIEPLCRVRGSMLLYDGAAIRTSSHSVHNHRPDFQRKNFVLFLQACKERAINEDLPLSQIYREECDKDPVSAAMISSQNMLQRMQRARKQTMQYYPTDEDQSEFAEACNSSAITTDIPPHELVEEQEEEDIQAQEESYEHIETATVTDDNELAEEDTESEAIERAISQLTSGESEECGSKEPSSEGGPVVEDQLQPSEVLPGIRPNSTMYHDGRGYYYIFNNHSENVWYLRCLEPHCRVRAHMEPVEGSPIIQSPNTLHNHRPDFKRKQFVLWMDQAKHRAVTEELPIPTICAQEAARDPQSANMIPQENMKTRLYRARKALANNVSSELEAAGEGGSEAAGNKDTEVMVADSECDQVQDSEAVFTVQAEGSQDSNTVYLYQPDNSPQKRPTYVDDKGFCYQQTTIRNSTRYLKCVEAGCKARASMGLEEDSAITLSKQGGHHNHTVEQSQLAMLLDQSDSDSAPMQVIYTDEDGGQQVALCHFADDKDPPKRPYRQRHKPELTIDPEEPPIDASVLCEVDVASEDVAEEDYYHNEDQQKYPLKPSEVIPGLRPDANNYHDGNGFYYELNRLSSNIRYLKCLIKDCKARAYMELGKENAPIIQTNFARHNHGPDLSRKQFTVFLHRVTRRAAEEDTPIHVIYQQEAERDPQSASQIRMENVKQRMMRFRKKHRQGKVMNQEASSAAELDVDGSIYHFFIGDEKPQLIHQDEAERVKEEEVEGVREEEEGEGEWEGEEVLYESYVVSEVEVESQQQQE